MFQGLLENLLKTLIGEYVEQIDGSNINMSVSILLKFQTI